MANNELYYDDLTNLAQRIAGGLKNRTQPLDELHQALKQLSTTNTVKGRAADSMQTYITEVHFTLIQALQLALNNYQMALGKYVKGYLEVDGNHDFKLVKEDLEAHARQLTSNRSNYTSLGEQLRAISNEAEDLVWLGGAGANRLDNVAQKMDQMKKAANDLKETWDNYERSDPGLKQVQELIARTQSLLQSTLKVPRGHSYKPGSFKNLIGQDFMNAFQMNAKYASDPANQKSFQDAWDSIGKDYAEDQKRLAEIATKKDGWDKLGMDIFFLLAGAAITVATGGAGAPLVLGLFVASLPTAVDIASDIRQIKTGETTNIAVNILEDYGHMDESSAETIWAGAGVLAGVAGSGGAYKALVERGILKGTVGEAKPIVKTVLGSSEFLSGNSISKTVSVINDNKNVLTSQWLPHLTEKGLDDYAIKQITFVYGKKIGESIAKKIANEIALKPSLDAIFGKNSYDSKIISKALGWTNLSEHLAHSIFQAAG